jgi:hypothetical protein
MAPTRNRNAWVIGGLVAALVGGPLLLVACAFAGWILWAGATFGERDPAFDQPQCEAFVGTAFPATATAYDGYQEGFQDGFFVCRFEIPPDDEAPFFGRTPFAGRMGTTTDNPFERADPTEAERIEAHGATRYEWFERELPGANEILFFDRSDPATTVVIWRRLER